MHNHGKRITDLEEDVAVLSAATSVELPIAEDFNMNRHAIRNTSLTTYYDSQTNSLHQLDVRNTVLTLDGNPVNSDTGNQSLSQANGLNTISLSNNGGTVNYGNFVHDTTHEGHGLTNVGSIAFDGAGDYPMTHSTYTNTVQMNGNLLTGFTHVGTADHQLSLLAKPIRDVSEISFTANIGANPLPVLTSNAQKQLLWDGNVVAHPETSGVYNPMPTRKASLMWVT